MAKKITDTKKESHSEEERVKMVEDKEKIEGAEEPKIEEKIEEAKEPEQVEAKLEEEKKETPTDVEEKVEEPKSEDVPAEEKPAEEVEPEAPVEEKKEEAPVEEESPDKKVDDADTEKLSADIKKTKEELSLIKEARDELVTQYAKFNIINKEKEQLSSDLEQLKIDFEALKQENDTSKEQLSLYVEAEKELNARRHQERLSALSVKFKQLGQEKTVEQLSSKDVETLSEFERIVDAALEKVDSMTAMPSATLSSQAVEKLEESDEKPVQEKKPVEKEQMRKSNDSAFYTQLSKALTQEQL